MSSRNDIEEMGFAVGDEGAAREWIGKTSETRWAQMPINRHMIRCWASSVRDSTPVYWDEDLSTRVWDGIVCPPGFLAPWKKPLTWSPAYMGIHDLYTSDNVLFTKEIPFPAEKDKAINVSHDVTFHRPIYEGTWLNWQSTITDVSDERNTKLGRGNFLSMETAYRNQRGQRLVSYTNTNLRFKPHESSDGSRADGSDAETEGPDLEDTETRDVDVFESIDPSDVEEGQSIPSFEYPVSHKTVIENAAATRDFFPGHNDPEFARRQGRNDIYLNTSAQMGLVDRLVIEWAGPEWRVVTRDTRHLDSAEAGDVLVLRGEVTGVEEEAISIDAEIYSKRNEYTLFPAEITISRNHLYHRPT